MSLAPPAPLLCPHGSRGPCWVCVGMDMLDPQPHPLLGDPARWVREVAKSHLWSKQVEILEAVRDHRKVAVKAAHGVGKSFCAARQVAYWLDVHPDLEAFAVTCYTDDTEVLTKDGWKLFADVAVGLDGDLFATRNQVTKEFEWQHAFAYHEAPWDGEVVDVQGKSLHLRVTPNHRMLVKWKDYTRGTSGEVLKPAENITRRGAELPALSAWKGESPQVVRFGRYEWDSVTFAAFLGAWLAEGSLGPPRKRTRKSDRRPPKGANRPSGLITLTQLAGTKGYEPYRDLLTRMIGREPYRSMDKNWSFACSDLWHYLSKLGRVAEKYIPAEVKEWGREELEALLHHYLLGDGWLTQPSRPGDKQRWRACTVSKRLADDLQEIAQKVGMSATITERAPRDSLIEGRPIPAGRQRLAYYLCFNTSECRSAKVSRSHYRGTVHCVSVPNEVLYVRRGGTATWCGNTAPTDPQVKAILWKEIKRTHRKGELPGRVTQDAQWKMNDELVAYGRKPADHDESGFQGIHSRYVLVVLDEAGGIPKQLWTAADTLVTNDDGRILAIGNPDDPTSEFATICAGAPEDGSSGLSKDGWWVITVSVFDTPNFTGEPVPDELRHYLTGATWVEERRRVWGVGSPLWKAKVLGQFPEDASDGVVPWSALKRCQQADIVAPLGDNLTPVRLGVDVGGSELGDESVIRAMAGHKALGGDAGLRRLSTSDSEEIVDAVIEQIVATGATGVNVDVIGVGFGVTGSLRRRVVAEVDWPVYVQGINVAEAANNPKRFVNKRAELWWTIGREWSQDAAWDLTDVDDETLLELAEPKYREVNGRVQVESKDDVRKRLQRSTDNADALLLAAIPPGAPARGKSPANRRTARGSALANRSGGRVTR